MTRHVSEGPASEIEEASPVEGLVETHRNIAVGTAGHLRVGLSPRGVWSGRRDAEPEDPLQSGGNRFGGRDFGQSLWPDRPVRPGMHFRHIADLA